MSSVSTPTLPKAKPAAPKRRAKTFKERQHEAEKRRQSRFVAAIAHLVHDMHPDPAGFDQWYLAIVLATVLGFLYTRDVFLVIIVFSAWYFFENFVWLSLGHFSEGVHRHMHAAESHDRELIIDPIVFALALATAWYVFEVSFVRQLIGDVPVVPISGGELLAGVFVALVSSFSGFPRAFWWMLFGTLAAIWIVYAFDTSDLKLVLAITASATTLYFYLWFVRPIARHFLYNALYAALTLSLIVSIVDISDPIVP